MIFMAIFAIFDDFYGFWFTRWGSAEMDILQLSLTACPLIFIHFLAWAKGFTKIIEI